jgi:hypothetical protein
MIHLSNVTLTQLVNSEKTDKDTVKNPLVGEPFVIEKDMLLNIHSIEIDDINLLLFKLSLKSSQ